MGLLAPGTQGVWCSVAGPTLLGLVARSGFDWVALDAQHGEFDRGALVEAGRTLTAAGCPFAVRVGRNDAGDIGLALDAGAATVVVPLVDTVEEARLAVAAAHYPPGGSRSWGPFAPLWGREAPEPALASPQVAVMLESARGLANVEEIAAVPGVDLLFVGPFDLALSLGVSVDDLLEGTGGPLATVCHAAESAGIGVAAFAGTPERAQVLRARGIDCLAVATEASVVSAGAQTLLARARPGA
ncbi:HpcH/HpaI aldolase family protein [Knoellia sp. CPCC 206435]|uniref:HpcH/HpaI aldolase family protein n=1 Tax=Knoellia terrae TaxID=3404797 RepID=UPI003B42963B